MLKAQRDEDRAERAVRQAIWESGDKEALKAHRKNVEAGRRAKREARGLELKEHRNKSVKAKKGKARGKKP